MNRRFDIELTRAAGDRRCYAFHDVGTLRLEGLLMRTATASAGAETWRFARRGFWQRAIEATDATGETVGTFAPRDIRRGGRLRWRKTDYNLRPAQQLARTLRPRRRQPRHRAGRSQWLVGLGRTTASTAERRRPRRDRPGLAALHRFRCPRPRRRRQRGRRRRCHRYNDDLIRLLSCGADLR